MDLKFLSKAKPIFGVAGSGEHTHVGIAARLKDGKIINLMSPADMKKDFLFCRRLWRAHGHSQEL